MQYRSRGNTRELAHQQLFGDRPGTRAELKIVLSISAGGYVASNQWSLIITLAGLSLVPSPVLSSITDAIQENGEARVIVEMRLPPRQE